MTGLEPGTPRAQELRPRSAPERSVWNSLRRRWKELARGRAEDHLLLDSRGDGWARSALGWAMLCLLGAAPVVGLAMDPWSPAARILLLLVTAAALLAAVQLEGRQRRSTLIGPTAAALLCTALATVLAVEVLAWSGPHAEGGLWIAYAFFPLLTGVTALRDDARLPSMTLLLCAASWVMVARSTPALEGVGAVPIAGPVLAVQLILLAATGALAAVAAGRGHVLRRAALLHSGTGLMNRRAFEACLEREASRARHAGRPFSIGRLQLDAFDELVRRYGRPMADAVERTVSAALRQRCRITDGVAYLEDGGFAIAFLGSAHPRLRERMDTLCRLLRDFEIPAAAEETPLRLAVRCGLASLPGDGEGASELLTAAERALEGPGGSRPFGVPSP